MKLEDFSFLRRGKRIAPLGREDVSLLAAWNARGTGREKALLLLHGFASSPAVYRAMLPLLPPYDAVVCPVLPGHGESLKAFSRVTARDWMISAEQACGALTKQYEQVDVLGLSLGGLLACHVNERFTLRHLYLLAPALALRLNIPCALRGARALRGIGIRTLRNRAGNLQGTTHAELAYRQLPLSAIIEILSFVRSFELKPTTTPTDLFLGQFDEVINSKRVANMVSKATPAVVHWLPHSAHVLPLDDDLEGIVDCLHQQF